MPSLSVKMPHALGQEEALARLQGYVAKLKARHQDKVSGLEEKWEDNKVETSFSTYGFKVSGHMIVGPEAVEIEGKLPLTAMMFKGKIEQTIRDELSRVLA